MTPPTLPRAARALSESVRLKIVFASMAAFGTVVVSAVAKRPIAANDALFFGIPSLGLLGYILCALYLHEHRARNEPHGERWTALHRAVSYLMPMYGLRQLKKKKKKKNKKKTKRSEPQMVEKEHHRREVGRTADASAPSPPTVAPPRRILERWSMQTFGGRQGSADHPLSEGASAAAAEQRPSLRTDLLSVKSRELLGVCLATVGMLLLLALASFHPADQSPLNPTWQPLPGIRNLIGEVGARAAALGFALLGLVAFLLPLFLLVLAWRWLRRQEAQRVFGRGLGVLLLLGFTPGLLQLALGRIDWRDGSMEAGGVVGKLSVEMLAYWLNVTGTMLVLLALVVVGSSLVLQSVVGEILQRWNEWLRSAAQRLWLMSAQRRDRKERSHQRVETSPASSDIDDDLYEEAVRTVVTEGGGSASPLQRRLRVSFSVASQLIEMMEYNGVLGPPQGSKPRELLVSPEAPDEPSRADRS